MKNTNAPAEPATLKDEQWISDAKAELMDLTAWLGDGCPGGPWRGMEHVNNIFNILDERNASF